MTRTYIAFPKEERVMRDCVALQRKWTIAFPIPNKLLTDGLDLIRIQLCIRPAPVSYRAPIRVRQRGNGKKDI